MKVLNFIEKWYKSSILHRLFLSGVLVWALALLILVIGISLILHETQKQLILRDLERDVLRSSQLLVDQIYRIDREARQTVSDTKKMDQILMASQGQSDAWVFLIDRQFKFRDLIQLNNDCSNSDSSINQEKMVLCMYYPYQHLNQNGYVARILPLSLLLSDLTAWDTESRIWALEIPDLAILESYLDLPTTSNYWRVQARLPFSTPYQDIQLDQWGIYVSADAADTINMTNSAYELNSWELYNQLDDLGGVAAVNGGSIALAAIVNNDIYSVTADSNMNLDSTLVNISADARVVSLDVFSDNSSEIVNLVSVEESIDATGSYLETDINVDTSLISVDVDFVAARSSDFDASGDLNGVLSIDVGVTDNSLILSSVDIRGSYDAQGEVNVDFDIEHIGVSIDLQYNSAEGLSLDAYFISAEITAYDNSQLVVTSQVDLDAMSDSGDVDLSVDIDTLLVSVENGGDSGFTENGSELTVSIEAELYSTIAVETSLDATVSAHDDVSVDDVDLVAGLVSIDQDDDGSEHFEVNIYASVDSNIRVALDTDLNITAGDDVSVELDNEAFLVSVDYYEGGQYTEIELEVDESSDMTVSVVSRTDIDTTGSYDYNDVSYDYTADVHGVHMLDVNDSESIDITVSVDEDSTFNVLLDHALSVDARDVSVEIDVDMTMINVEFAGLYSGDVYYASLDDSERYDLGNSGDRYIGVSADDYSHIAIIASSELIVNAGNSTEYADVEANVEILVNGIQVRDGDAVEIDLAITDHSSMVVGAVVSDEIHPNDLNVSGSYDIYSAPEFGNVDLDYNLRASVISLDNTDYAVIDIDVLNSSELIAYTSYDTNLDESNPVAGLYTHDIRVRQDSHIISIDGHFSTIMMDVSGDSLVEAGSIISIDGWGNDIQISVFDSSDMIANDGDVVHIEFYATPDRSYDIETRQEFGNDIRITVDDSYLSANDDVVDVGAHSTDVHFVGTNSAEIEADGSLVKLNGKHQDVHVELTNEATVSISHDENMIEIIGQRATVSLDMSHGSEISLDLYDNLDDRNVIDVQGRYADVHVNIGAALFDEPRSYSPVSSEDTVDIYAEDLIEIDGGDAHVQVSIDRNAGSLEFSGDFIEVRGATATVDLSINDSRNICVDDDMVRIDGDFASVDVSITNSSIEVGQLVHISGDAYELNVYIDDSSVCVDDDMIHISSEGHHGNAAYISLEIYDSNLGLGDSLVDIDNGDNNHIYALIHGGSLSVDGEIFDIDDNENTLVATFVNTEIDDSESLLSIDGDSNDINITLSEIYQAYGYMSSDGSLDIDIEGYDNHVELNLNDGSVVSVDAWISGDSNSISIDLNDESYLALDLGFSVDGGNDFDLAINLERESEMDFRFAFGSYDDSGYGNISLDLTLNDGSRVNGYVYLSESMDLDFTTNVHDHDHNSHVWFSLDEYSNMTVDHLDVARNENMDLRYTGYYADLYLEADYNYDRIDIENSYNFEVWNFTDEDTLMIDGDSFSWHTVLDDSSNQWSWDYDEWDSVYAAANGSDADAIFFHATDGQNYWDFDDLRAAVEYYEDNGWFNGQDIYFVETGNYDSIGTDLNDIKIYQFNGDNLIESFELSATIYNAAGYFDSGVDRSNAVVTGYLNNYFNDIIL